MNSTKAVLVVILTVLLGIYVSQAFALSEIDFQTVGQKYGVSPYLLMAIATVESQNGELLGKYLIHEVVDETQLKYW